MKYLAYGIILSMLGHGLTQSSLKSASSRTENDASKNTMHWLLIISPK